MNKTVKILLIVIATIVLLDAIAYIVVLCCSSLEQNNVECEYIETPSNNDYYEDTNYKSYNNTYENSYDNSYNTQQEYQSKPEAYEFSSRQSVILYLRSRSYYNSDKDRTITFNNGCIHINGVCMTHHIDVVEAAGTQAVISGNSPYGGKLVFLVDTEYGCIANNDYVYFEK